MIVDDYLPFLLVRIVFSESHCFLIVTFCVPFDSLAILSSNRESEC